MAGQPTGALSGLRVLELGGLPASYTGHSLADLGADVIKVEPPGGAPERASAPFFKDEAGPDRGLAFIHINADKRSIVLDLATDDARNTLRLLASSADAVVEAYPVGYLDRMQLGYSALRANNPGLIMVSLTPFGQTGPLRGYKGPNAVAEAVSGLLYNLNDDSEVPCASPHDFLTQVAGMHAAAALLAAAHHRRLGGEGQFIDISLQEVGTHMQSGLADYAFRRRFRRRLGIGRDPATVGIMKTKDAYVFFQPAHPQMWAAFVQWCKDPVLAGKEFENREFRGQNADLVDHLMNEFAGKFSSAEFIEEAQKRGIPTGPILPLGDFARSEQVKVLGSLHKKAHPVIGTYEAFDFLRMRETPIQSRRPAPRLGEHQQEVLEEARRTITQRTAAGAQGTDHRKPLEGIRVLDFSRVIAGPLGTQFLGFLGAEVIKVESKGLFTGREGAGFADLNRAKKSVTLDVRSPRGRDLTLELASMCDVIVNNFSAGVMDRLGIGYEAMRTVRPDIIYVNMPGFGDIGPLKDWVAFGPMVQAYSGLTWMWRHPDLPLNKGMRGPVADNVSGATVMLAVTAALHHRDRTGQGQYIDVLLLEGLAAMLDPFLMEAQLNGREAMPRGYQSNRYAPYGCYPCRGDDAWCVVAVETEEEWKAFQKAVGEPGWALDAAFQTREGRIARKRDLDAHITTWTKEYTARQVMHFLQIAGVPAGVVQNAEDLYYDYHLRKRGHLVDVTNPPWGTYEFWGVPWLFSGTPGDASVSPPALGQNNEEVFRGLMGMSAEEFKRNQESKVIY